MADAAPDTSQPSTDISALVGGGSKGTIADLVGVQKQKASTDAAITAEADKRMTRDQAVADKAFAAEGVSAAEQLKPWDADKQHKKYEADPIEGFGSLGGLFAVVASAFTKAPMENAINGMAGAINSLKEGKEAAYTRAHESWKENTKLALDRFKTQHELYSDALGMMDHDYAASQAKLHNAAVRFGDQQTLMLAEHGMVKELIELQSSRAAAAEQMQASLDATTDSMMRRKAFEAGAKDLPKTGNPALDAAHKLALWQNTHGGDGKSPQQALMGRFFLENPDAKADAAAKFADDHGIIRQYGTAAAAITEPKLVAQEIKRRADAYVADGMDPNEAFDRAMKEIKTAERKPDQPKLPTENNVVATEISKRADDYIAGGMEPHAAFDRAMKEIKAASAKPGATDSANIPGRADQAIVNKRAREMRDADPSLSETEAYERAKREVKEASTPPSANRADDLRSKIDQTDNILTASQKNLDFLHNFKGGAGLMGKLMRGEEIASNVTGAGTGTERVEFRRRVHELQEMVPRIITDSNGRPLKAAQDKVDDFVAGLNAGDTGPNTIRAYEELIAEMQKRQQDYRGRLEGGYKPGQKSSGSDTAAPAGSPADNTDWLNAYPVKNGGSEKRSSLDTPPVSGARKAPDGNWYLPDPKRRGKYLQVQVG
jgi:hypothetical protein